MSVPDIAYQARREIAGRTRRQQYRQLLAAALAVAVVVPLPRLVQSAVRYSGPGRRKAACQYQEGYDATAPVPRAIGTKG
eukprot:1840674-Rhodomonas_salina.2